MPPAVWATAVPMTTAIGRRRAGVPVEMSCCPVATSLARRAGARSAAGRQQRAAKGQRALDQAIDKPAARSGPPHRGACARGTRARPRPPAPVTIQASQYGSATSSSSLSAQPRKPPPRPAPAAGNDPPGSGARRSAAPGRAPRRPRPAPSGCARRTEPHRRRPSPPSRSTRPPRAARAENTHSGAGPRRPPSPGISSASAPGRARPDRGRWWCCAEGHISSCNRDGAKPMRSASRSAAGSHRRRVG